MGRRVGQRARPAPMVKGKAVPVDMAEVRELIAAQKDVRRAKQRLTNVTNRLRRRLGDAQFGTVGPDIIVIGREPGKTGGRYAAVNYRDDLRVNLPGLEDGIDLPRLGEALGADELGNRRERP